jgi:hypothetical protein
VTSAGAPSGPGVADWVAPSTYLERLAVVEGERLNVKSAAYGAVGDNITNDTAAVQAAITAAGAAGGGIVFFPRGVYKVGALTLPANVTLEGVAYDTNYTARGSRLSLIAGTNASMFTVPWGTPNIQLRDLHLEGNNASQTGTSWGIYFAGDTVGPTLYQQSFVFRCSIKGFESGGVFVGKWNQAVNIDQCFIADNLGHGVQIEGSDNQVSNSHILANGGDGVRLGNSSCQVTDCPSIAGNLRGVAVVSGGAAPTYTVTTDVRDHQIIGNHLDANLQEGVYIQGLNVALIGNQIGGNSQQTNNTYGNVWIDGKLSDNATFSYGHQIVGNQFVNKYTASRPNRPTYHVVIGNYSGSSTGDIVESGNYYDLTTNSIVQSSATNDFSKFRGGSTGQTAAAHYVASHAGSTTTIAAGAAAGTTPPTPTLSNANDARGQINAGTGTGPSAGAQVAVTFAQPYRAVAPSVVLTPLNAATAALQAYVSASTTGFSVFTTAPAASQTVGTYQWTYQVLG